LVGRWAVLLLVAVALVFSANYAHAELFFKFDQPVVVIEHGTILVYRNDEALNGAVGDTRSAQITINSGAPISVTLTERKIDGIFTSPILKFTTGIGDSSQYIFQVTPGATTLGATLTDIEPPFTAPPAAAQIQVVADDTAAQTFDNRRFSTAFPNCNTITDIGDPANPNDDRTGDTDSDGICDAWEDGLTLRVDGYPSGAATAYQFTCSVASPCDTSKKDIFVAIDFMKGHRPNDQIIQEVINAFAAQNIRAHVQVDESDFTEILHKTCTTFPGTNFGSTMGFDQIKARFFGTNQEEATQGAAWFTEGWHQKRAAFHYVLFVNSICGNTGASGSAELLGNDVIISLGNFDRGIGSLDQQAGTLLHEIGHNLNLRHGGSEDKNCKPLYLSVMNYAYQFEDLVNNRPLSYSSNLVGLVDPNNPGTPILLNEASVNEAFKVSDISPQQKFTYGPVAPVPLPQTGQIGVNWNPSNPPGQITAAPNLDNIRDSFGTNMCPNTTNDVLSGYNDWPNIKLDSKGTSNYMDGKNVGGVNEESGACPRLNSISRTGTNTEQRTCSGGTGSNRIDNTGYTRVQMILIKYESALSGLEQLRNEQPMSSNSQYNTTISELRTNLENSDWKAARAILQDIRQTYSSNEHVKKVVNDALQKSNISWFNTGKEVTDENVRDMRASRIGALSYYIDNLPESDFKNNDKSNALTYYHKRFAVIVNLIKNGDTDRTMKKAIDELLSVQKTYDGKADVEDLITTDRAHSDLLIGTSEVLASYSNAINDPKAAGGNKPTVELDQNTYTWTDKAYITVVAPDYNYDSNLIDVIGNTPDAEIEISTSLHTINSYQLVETGTDTGIFTGNVVLTGFEHDADGDGTNDITNPVESPDGSGPTNGFLPADREDTLTVSFKTVDDTIVGSSLIRWNVAQVSWLNASYPSNGTGVVRVIDPDMNLNPEAVDSFEINVWSDSDAGGIDLTVTETNEATGIFEGTVVFTTTDSSSGHRIRVAPGDTVTTEYVDNTLPAPYTSADTLDVSDTTSMN